MENIPIRHINTTQKEPSFSKSFGIKRIQDLLSGKDMIQELHRHDFFYVLVLRKGAGHHEIDFKPYPVSDNSIFFMRPGQVHQHILKAGSTGYLMAFKTVFFYPNDSAPKHLLRKASATNFYILNSDIFKKLFSILDYIFKEYTNKNEGYIDIIKANLIILCTELVRQDNKTHANRNNLYAQERLEQFLELLEIHIYKHKQVSEYANMLNLSTYQLNTILKSTLGKTCSELINEYIILEAKRHLIATTSQVSQIAYHLGYEDVSYFIRFFKKHTEYTPEAFRHNFR
ncbi:helix-turn-helix domain-containing protein [Aquimarina muelleri]|uniref:AraC family transcriptional regulator n=1 Tax=Aquimarina muelleri TaxID=279356 RepID=A0A918JTW8_9FLAO|nr:helix-turn-helix domain-containing protein [Aquimarina muelleri]MCX2761894.1 AraC family transcriptional regulator [Aquimarina muelleri]GGX10157.1 AraC family transcriptional regulator [Aquimarina muelleri]